MFRFIFLFLISFFAFSGLQAQEPGAIVLLHEQHIRIQNEKWVQQTSYDVQINRRDGESYTIITVPYSGSQRISNIRAEIVDHSGKIIKTLRQQDITDRHNTSSAALYEDEYVKEFKLKHSQYPYRIRYSYERAGSGLLTLSWWYPLLSVSIPTRDASLTVDIPLGYPISFRSKGARLANADTLGKRVFYRWKASYIDLFEEEFASPPVSDFLPFVHIVPLKISYGIDGKQDSWASFGRWADELNKDLELLSPQDQALVHSLVVGATELTDKIKILYHYLQDQTRYVNVSIGIGGLRSFPASYSASRKYGDCKALSTYMKAMLAVAGIPSFRALVLSGSKIPLLDKGFPSQQFDHVILCVPAGSDTLWLDCTSDEAFGYAGSFIQNRPALVVNGDSSFLSHIPALSDYQVTNHRIVHIKWNESARESELLMDHLFRGEQYSTFLSLSKQAPGDIRDQHIRQLFRNMKLSTEHYEFLSTNRDSCHIRLICKAKAGNLFQWYGNELVVGILPFFSIQPEAPGKRKLPVQFDYPVIRTDSLIYLIPEGYILKSLPENYRKECLFGSYAIEYHDDGKSLTIIKSVRLNPGTINSDQYKAYYEFMDQVIRYEQFTRILLTKKQE